MEQKHHIVVLDDDYKILKGYFEELECLGFSVTVTGTFSEFMEVLSSGKTIDLFVIDVMMPPGESPFTDLASDDGRKTGLMIGRWLREKGIKTPIIFFSIAWLEEDISRIKNYEKMVENSVHIKKTEVLPSELGTFIQAVLKKGKVPGNFSKLLKRLVNSLELKPNICGVGIDIKKLVE